jgi:hypothetical protein
MANREPIHALPYDLFRKTPKSAREARDNIPYAAREFICNAHAWNGNHVFIFVVKDPIKHNIAQLIIATDSEPFNNHQEIFDKGLRPSISGGNKASLNGVGMNDASIILSNAPSLTIISKCTDHNEWDGWKKDIDASANAYRHNRLTKTEIEKYLNAINRFKRVKDNIQYKNIFVLNLTINSAHKVGETIISESDLFKTSLLCRSICDNMIKDYNNIRIIRPLLSYDIESEALKMMRAAQFYYYGVKYDDYKNGFSDYSKKFELNQPILVKTSSAHKVCINNLKCIITHYKGDKHTSKEGSLGRRILIVNKKPLEKYTNRDDQETPNYAEKQNEIGSITYSFMKKSSLSESQTLRFGDPSNTYLSKYILSHAGLPYNDKQNSFLSVELYVDSIDYVADANEDKILDGKNPDHLLQIAAILGRDGLFRFEENKFIMPTICEAIGNYIKEVDPEFVEILRKEFASYTEDFCPLDISDKKLHNPKKLVCLKSDNLNNFNAPVPDLKNKNFKGGEVYYFTVAQDLGVKSNLKPYTSEDISLHGISSQIGSLTKVANPMRYPSIKALCKTLGWDNENIPFYQIIIPNVNQEGVVQ